MSHLRLVGEGEAGWENPFRVLICGSRNFSNRSMVELMVHGLLSVATLMGRPLLVIEGGARGADDMARVEAENIGVRVMHCPADWNRHGKKAGILRNIEMLERGRPELVVAFTDDIDKSAGTKHMVTIARQANVPVYVMGHPVLGAK